MGHYRADPYLGGITFTPNRAGYMATVRSRNGVIDHVRVMQGHRIMGLRGVMGSHGFVGSDGVMGHSYRVIRNDGVI